MQCRVGRVASSSSAQSDVYSLGTLFLHVSSDSNLQCVDRLKLIGRRKIHTGLPPYHWLRGEYQVLAERLANKPQRRPSTMPDSLWELISWCWQPVPAEQPTAAQVLSALRSMQNKSLPSQLPNTPALTTICTPTTVAEHPTYDGGSIPASPASGPGQTSARRRSSMQAH